MRAFLLCILWVIPKATAAAPTRAAVTTGVAVPPGASSGNGIAVGLEGGLRLGSRMGAQAAVARARHTLSQGGKAREVDATVACLGLEIDVDLAPVVPSLGIGGAYQRSTSEGSSTRAHFFGAFFSLGVSATLLEHLFLGAEARYLTASFASETFPAYSLFLLRVGWTPG